MSRVGRKPIRVPDKVDVKLDSGGVRVKGPLGELFQEIPDGVAVEVADNEIVVSRASDEKKHRALHGLVRSLIQNMVHGVHAGFARKLQIVGVGYNARIQGSDLTLQIGFAHPVVRPIPEGLSLETPSATEIVVKGADKQLVGQFAADIRRIRPPEPYNGKGIRYEDEHVRRKAGKAFVGGGD
jgi:large subunit ribosomal protein L6